MAKSKTLDEAIIELLNDFHGAVYEAAKYATKKAEEDIYNYSMSFLQEYYDERPPNSYNRSDSLKHAFIKFSNIKNGKRSIECEAGVEYSAWVLEQYVGANNNYAYDASKKYGQVDAEWVIDNYLRGVHPSTNGSGAIGAPYFEIFGENPTVKMHAKLVTYEPTFSKNLLLSFSDQIVKILRR